MKKYLLAIITFSLIIAGCNKEQEKTSAKTSEKEVVDTVKRISPKAEVMQLVNKTEIRINYSRPGVKGRKIWGELVPFNTIWRAGADEATKFTFSKDVKIEGMKIPAGSYSFFVIPTKDKWTIIFNKVADQWGPFSYNKNEDAARFELTPVKNKHTEWLTYSFTYEQGNTAHINLEWEKLKIRMLVETE